MKIYLASSWRNEFQPEVLRYLLNLGHEVYDFRNPSPGDTGFSWAEIDPLWKDWAPWDYVQKLSHPLAESGFKKDFDAMKWADICVLLLPSGRSAHTEAGWMKGSGKKVYVFMPLSSEPELMYKLYDGVLTEFCELSKITCITG